MDSGDRRAQRTAHQANFGGEVGSQFSGQVREWCGSERHRFRAAGVRERGSTPQYKETTMRYMMLIYTQEKAAERMAPEEMETVKATHWAGMEEARKKGKFQVAEPLN